MLQWAMETILTYSHTRSLDMYDKLNIWLKKNRHFAKEFKSMYNSNCELSTTGCVMKPTTMQQKREIRGTLRKQLQGYQKIAKITNVTGLVLSILGISCLTRSRDCVGWMS